MKYKNLFSSDSRHLFLQISQIHTYYVYNNYITGSTRRLAYACLRHYVYFTYQICSCISVSSSFSLSLFFFVFRCACGDDHLGFPIYTKAHLFSIMFSKKMNFDRQKCQELLCILKNCMH